MRAFAADASLGDQVQDAAAAFFVARIPVLHRGVAHVGVFLNYYLHYRRVQLVGVAHRGGAAFHIAEAGAFVGHDQGTLELPGAGRVDAEVAAEVHGALDALGDVAERAVGEHCRVEGGVEVVACGDDACQILADEVGVLLHRFAEAAEDDAFFGQMLPESGADGYGVEDGVDRNALGAALFPGEAVLLAFRLHACQHLPFAHRNAQFIEGFFEFRVDFGGAVFVFYRGGIVDYVLKVDFRQTAEVAPAGRRHALPFMEGVQAEVQQPLRLVLLCRDEPYGVLREAFGNELLPDLGFKPFAVFPGGYVFQ